MLEEENSSARPGGPDPGPVPSAANAKLEAIFEQLDNCGEIPKDKLLSEYIYEQSLKGNQEDTAPQPAI